MRRAAQAWVVGGQAVHESWVLACLRYDLAHRVLLSLHLGVERCLTLHPLQCALDVPDDLEQDRERIGSLCERAFAVFGELEPDLEC